MTFGAFGETSSWPTVPTCRPGTFVTASRTATVNKDAPIERVLTLRHRRRPGVVREAGDDGRVPLDRDDAFDDADRHGASLERAALLDVQLDDSSGARPSAAPRP